MSTIDKYAWIIADDLHPAGQLRFGQTLYGKLIIDGQTLFLKFIQ